MKEYLSKLMNNQLLDFQESKNVIYALAEDQLNDYQLVVLMTGLQQRGVTTIELAGFQEALIELAVPLKLEMYSGIDLCGTGGDGKNTFNISTTTSFVLASMGYPVLKHGNFGVSSISGSSTVFQELGIQFPKTEDEIKRMLDRYHLAVIHAPLFHPILKKVAPIRQNLGIRTFFNALGPLINPAKPSFQLTGTFGEQLARSYQLVLQKQRKNFKVFYNVNGYDELALDGTTKSFGKDGYVTFTEKDFGIDDKILARDIQGGKTAKEACLIVRNILQGRGTNKQHQVIAANVACAIQLMKPEESLKRAYNEALEHIQSGNTYLFFKPLLQ